MHKTTTVTIGSIFALLFLVASGILFFSHILTKSLPKYHDKKTFGGISAAINIERDELGVPHSIASNEHDAYFAMGYIHAEERLWQMDIQRLIAQGKLSEFFGEQMLDFDILFRTLNLTEKSSLLVQQCSPHTLELLDAYSLGINSFISSYSSSLPLEFSILNYAHEKWSAKDCILTLLLFDLLNNNSLAHELLISRICQYNDNQKVLPLFPFQNENTVLKTDSTSFPSFFFTTFLAFNEKFQLQQNERITSFAILPPKRSKPLTATTYYTSTSILFRWFILQTTFENNSIVGVTIPGIPIIFSGKNNSIAWTCYPNYSASKNFLHSQNSYPQFFLRNENIKVKKRNDVVTIKIQETQWGTIINTVLRDDVRQTSSTRRPVILRKFADSIQFTLDFYFTLHTSTTLDEVQHNIEKHHFKNKILLVNEKSILVSPNDSSKSPYSILTEEHTSWEYIRLRSILDTINNFNLFTCRDIQNTIISLRANKIIPMILSSFENETQLSKTIQLSLQHLRNWDNRSLSEEIAPTLFNAFFYKLLECTLEDEIGKEMLQALIQQEYLVSIMMDNILLHNNEEWFDNIHTEKKETRDEILRTSYRAAIFDLEKYYGTEMKLWQWKYVHSLSYYHPLGERSELFKTFFLTQPTTITRISQKRTEQIFLKYFYLEPQLTSAKLMIDFSSPQEIFVTIFAGESGHPLSANYKNFMPLLLNNDYHKINVQKKSNLGDNSVTLLPQ